MVYAHASDPDNKPYLPSAFGWNGIPGTEFIHVVCAHHVYLNPSDLQTIPRADEVHSFRIQLANCILPPESLQSWLLADYFPQIVRAEVVGMFVGYQNDITAFQRAGKPKWIDVGQHVFLSLKPS